MNYPRCILKKDREKSALNFHPWIFSGAIDSVEESIKAGDWVAVYSSKEDFLGIGYFNPKSQITVRLMQFEEKPIDASFWEKRIVSAIALRKQFILSDHTNACRLINSEGDFLPGLVVDQYHDHLVVQFSTAGMDRCQKTIVDILKDQTEAISIAEKGNLKDRELEGLERRDTWLLGESRETAVFVENGLRFQTSFATSQKTGFFFDQRENRKLIRNFSLNKTVLDCFCYTGGFSTSAAAGGANKVVSVDISEPAIETARKHVRDNAPQVEHEAHVADVFDFLRSFPKNEADLIILDPPAFCKNKNQIPQASRGYKDINLEALKKIAPGGLLYTASCSSFISPDLFQKIIFGAAKDAKRAVTILTRTGHALDHPVSIYHPEGDYLKGLLLRVV